MKPLPLSWTHYDDFNTCPRQFYGKRVAKKFNEPQSEAQVWGETVHKAFEDRINKRVPLPAELSVHEPFLSSLAALPGNSQGERKIGISQSLQACGFFDKNVWYRGAIDFSNIHESRAVIVDYKTGKVKPKWGQLKMNALWAFIAYPEIETIKAQFYWTQTRETSDIEFNRSQTNDIWKEMIPNLQQMLEAYQTDTWQPRKSGLCAGWCPDKECEFWRPKREWR